MSDVLGVLAARSLGIPAAVRPAIRPLYDGDGGLLAAPGDGVLDEEAGPAVAGEAAEAGAVRDVGHGPRATAPAGAAARATDVVVGGVDAGADGGGRDARDGARDEADSARPDDPAPAAYGVRAASGATPAARATTAEPTPVDPSDAGAAEPARAAGVASVDRPVAPDPAPRRAAAERAPVPDATQPAGVVEEPTLSRAAAPAPALVPLAVEPRRPTRAPDGAATPVPDVREADGDGARVVHVSIGRIDVRAVPAPAPERRQRGAPRRPTVGLEEYLRARDGRR